MLSYHYARRLRERGHEVLVVGPRADGDRDADRRAGIESVRFPGYGLGVLRFFPFAVAVLAAIRRQRPEVVLAMNVAYGGLVCFFLSRLCRFRYVTMAYAYEFLKFARSPLLSRLYRAIYRRSCVTIAVSCFARDRLAEFGVPASLIEVVYPGVQAPAAASGAGDAVGGAGGRFPVLGTCGRLIRRKGHDLVIRALPRILERRPDTRYVVVGQGPERAALQRLAHELGVGASLELRGAVGSDELDSFYRSLDLFVMPSREDRVSGHAEGFGIVYMEAAAYGVPSVAARAGGAPEAVLDGETGVLVAPDDPAALAEAIVALLADEAGRRRMGEAARRRAAEDFDWDDQVDRVEALIRHRTLYTAP